MKKIRTKPFPAYNPFGKEEVAAVQKVVQSGMLSNFVAKPGDHFLGGKHVKELEQRWADYAQVRHAISFNSATSGLVASLGALEIMPGDEVLVISYSMCISATAPLFYDAIPVFVDIEPDFYCMDPDSIEGKITKRTKAILTVDLFGQSSDMKRINAIAKKHNLKVVNDAAHVPGCRYSSGYAGTFGDIGVYSLNQHKIIHCGEGGIAVTNDDDLAYRLQLIRNHAEAVVAETGYPNLKNMLGGNYRLGEMEAAVAIEQLKKLPTLLRQRIDLAEYLTEKLSPVEFLTPPAVREDSEHVYYLYPIKFNEEACGMSRAKYAERIRELGIPLYKFAEGYMRPLYLDPIFSKADEFKNGYPYSLIPKEERQTYQKGLCPITEILHEKEMIVTAYNYPPLRTGDMDDIVKAFTLAGMKQ